MSTLNLTSKNPECYKTLLDFCPNMIFINVNGRIVYVNNKCEEIIGYSKDEFLSEDFNFMTLLHPDSLDLAMSNYKKHQNSVEIEQQEYRLLKKDGGAFHAIHTTKFIQYDGSMAIFGIVTDISELKKLEGDLKTSEEKYRNLVENIEEVIYIVATTEDSLKGQTTFASRQIEKITGYSPDEFIKNSNLWFESLHPDDVPGVVKDTKELIMLKKKIVRNYRLRHKKSGEYSWLEDYATPTIDSKGAVLSFFGVARDITECKKSENELQKIRATLEKNIKECTSDLEETNTALKVLLQQIKSEKSENEENILSNMKNLVFPYISKLKKGKLSSKELDHLNTIESNLIKITSGFSSKLSSNHIGLTPKEITIAKLIQDGKQAKDISEALNISLETVKTHIQNIRKKLGLYGTRTNLRSYLISLFK